MSTKHTPGPWIADDEHVVRVATPRNSGTSYCEPIKVATGWIEGAWHGTDSDEESRANARLIAAAPELLAFVDEYIDAWGNGMAGDGYLLRLAESIRSKATGGQQ